MNQQFFNSSQNIVPILSELLKAKVILKDETNNPIGCFKGRGTEYFLEAHANEFDHFVCGSAGNFGQGLAYSGRDRGKKVTVFAAVNANPLKIEKMRAFGAEVILIGKDFDAAKEEARKYAEEKNAKFVEDGKEPEIAAGAGTIACELIEEFPEIDQIIVPVGDGSLINGIAKVIKAQSPKTKIVGVCAAGAPAMYYSWKEKKLVTTTSVNTIADGVAVRAPIPEAVAEMNSVVNEVAIISDNDILQAMKYCFNKLDIALEPAGAVGVAYLLSHPENFNTKTVATILCGTNITDEQRKQWYF